MKATERHKLIDRIKTLEGLTDDERSALLGLLRESKTYGLVWEDKPEAVEERLRNELPVLFEDKERALTDVGPDAPNHILIEGDNLEALTTLAYTHAGKIDVIYIDPPYNTGNKDFVYNDSYVDSEDSYRHSKWLSFMSRRLRIAKKLLSDRGVIFISIDDNEQSALKLLCNEIFGEKNCLANLIWDLGSGTSAGHFTRAHEYVLCYSYNRTNLENFSGGEGIIDDRAIKKLSAKNHEFEYTFKAGTRFEAQDGLEFTGIWGGSEKTSLIKGRMLCINGQLAEDVTLSACWTQKNQMDSFFAGKPTIDSKGQEVLEFYFRSNGKLYCRKKRDKINPPSILRNVATTKQGSSLLKELVGDNAFSFPKPLQLLQFLLSLRDSDSIVLDFFAGSGTTLHAVMQLNAEDGGKRQCILCTNNENGICENVTYERNKRVIEGYTKPNGEHVEGLHNNNLRYYRTDFVVRSRSTKNMRRLVQLSTDMLCIKENLYTEEKTFAGLPTYKNIYRYFEHGDKKMLIIYDERYVDEIVKMIASIETTSKIKVYVFSPSEDPWEANFEPVIDKVDLCALPQAIYNTYKRILPKRVGSRPGATADITAGSGATAGPSIIPDNEAIGGLFAAEPKGGDE